MMNTIEQFNCLSYLGNQELRKSGKIEKNYTHGSYQIFTLLNHACQSVKDIIE